MEMEQSLIVYAVNRLVNIVQRDLIKCFCKVCAAASLTSFHDPCIAQLPENIADYHRIYPRTARQDIAGHSHLSAKNVDTGEDMHRHCEFTCYLHRYSSLFTPLPR